MALGVELTPLIVVEVWSGFDLAPFSRPKLGKLFRLVRDFQNRVNGWRDRELIGWRKGTILVWNHSQLLFMTECWALVCLACLANSFSFLLRELASDSDSQSVEIVIR